MFSRRSRTDEAWARTKAAAGRRPWGLVVAATLIGGLAGFVAAGVLRSARERRAEIAELETSADAVIVTPSYEE